MGQLHALLLWIDDRRVTWFNGREVISFLFLVLIFGSQNGVKIYNMSEIS
jgi:hypothetical protein